MAADPVAASKIVGLIGTGAVENALLLTGYNPDAVLAAMENYLQDGNKAAFRKSFAEARKNDLATMGRFGAAMARFAFELTPPGDVYALGAAVEEGDGAEATLAGIGLIPLAGDIAKRLGRSVDEVETVFRSADPKAKRELLEAFEKAGGTGSDRALTPVLPGRMPPYLARRPTSGVKLYADPNRTTTVLGRYDDDMGEIIKELNYPKTMDFGSKKGGFNVLNTPDTVYKNPEQFWKEYNKPFLDSAIKRGDRIFLATKPSDKVLFSRLPDGTAVNTGFGREYNYLLSKGYRYDSKTSSMVKK